MAGWDLDAMAARLDAALMGHIDEYRSAAESAVRPKARRLVWDSWLAANGGEPVSSKQAVAAGIFGVPVPPDVWFEASKTPGLLD